MNDKQETLFSYIKEIYAKLGNPDDLVELMSDIEILREIAGGKSNSSISMKFDIPEREIKEVAKKYLGFDGFEEDSDFDIYAIFKRNMNLDSFSYEITLLSTVDTDKILEYYNICKKYYELENKLIESWK